MANIYSPPCDVAVIQAGKAHAACADAVRPWVLGATILGSSMVFIDGTVVNVALPVIQSELGASVAGTQWVMEAYSLFLAALILMGGSMGDLFGRRRMFVVGIVIFTAASAGCGLSRTLAQMIIARAVQGIGGALMAPESLAIISASFQGEERGRAIGTWSGFTSLASAAGPVLGGWLIAAGSWRYAFFLNVPIAAITLLLTARVPESQDRDAPKRLDLLGAALATLGLGSLVYGLVTASSAGFGHVDVIASLAAGPLLLAAFVLAEARVPQPMMPLRLFRSAAFSGANIFTLLLYAGLGGALFFLPFNLIQVHGYSPQGAGAALLPLVLLIFLLSRWSGGLVARYGARLPLMVGPIAAAAGYALFALPGTGGSYWTTFFPAVLVLGLGMAISVAPLSTTVMNAVDPAHAGLASGINNAVSRTSGLVALAVFGVFVVLAFDSRLEQRIDALQLPAQVQSAVVEQRGKLAAVEIPGGLDAATTGAIRAAIDSSFVSGFRVAMVAAAGLALGASGCAALTMKRDQSRL
ncbi:MAG TPA: MFS transporter [Chloroflexota bacterium]|jgi:EmrB/QacA subfamily drug resistance transporter|nr:MFS transporter [Chloroflexota bacterium]